MANKNKEIVGFSDEDLASEIVAAEREYQKIRFDHSVKSLADPSILNEMRKDIARMKTEVRKRELANTSDDVLAMRDRIRARRRK